MTRDPTNPRHFRLPADAFYWTMLDTSALPVRAARRPNQLGYLFESVLPIPIEQIHASYLPLTDGRVLACGMDRDRIAALATPGVLTLGPTAAPAFVGDAPEPCEINLLHGRFEPREVARVRGQVIGLCTAAVLACALLVLTGQLRRSGSHNRAASEYTNATGAVYDQILPPSTSSLPPAARLTAELRSLDRTRSASPAAAGPREAAPTLAALLASWPADLYVSTEALSVSDTAITLTARLPDSAAAERFERELRAPAGWRLAQPDVRAERDSVLFRARMEPSP